MRPCRSTTAPADRRRLLASGLWPWLAAGGLWLLAFAISCRIGSAAVESAAPDSGSVAGRMLGGARAAFGAHFFEVADLYFHRGVEHRRRQALTNDLFLALARVVSPPEHVHRSGSSVREIMPWLWLAVRANPRDVEACLVAAYWLARDLRRPDLALETLREARIDNPTTHRIPLEQARILLRLGQWDEALRSLDVGLALWPGGEDPNSEDALLDKRNLLLHRSLLLESRSQTAAAMADLQEILRLFPDSPALRRRVAELAAGSDPRESALKVLHKLLDEEVRSRVSAEHEESSPPQDDSVVSAPLNTVTNVN